MTPAQIEQMAREAGGCQTIERTEDHDADFVMSTSDLARFAELVAKAERERMSKTPEEMRAILDEAELQINWLLDDDRSEYAGCTHAAKALARALDCLQGALRATAVPVNGK